MPGVIIAMARLNRPSLMVYGGTIKPGYSSITSKPIDVVSAFQSYGVLSPHCFLHAVPVDLTFQHNGLKYIPYSLLRNRSVHSTHSQLHLCKCRLHTEVSG